MILLLLHALTSIGLHVPKLFFYVSTRMIFGQIFGLGLTIFLGKFFIRKLYELKIGHTVRVSDVPALSEQYQKSVTVPSMGGILFITSILLSSLLWMDFASPFSWILILSMVWMGAIGFVDDLAKIRKGKSFGIPGRTKFVLQVLFSLLLSVYMFSSLDLHPPAVDYAAQYYIPFFKKPIIVSGGIGIVCAALLTIFVITGSTNAVNLSDGLDGLAAGLALFVAMVLAIVAFLSNNVEISNYLNILYIEGSAEIAVFLCTLMGALLGFLWYNGYPAQIFMGDTGSLAIGAVLGVSAVLLRREFLYALVGGVFVMETLSVILQVASFKYRRGKRIFLCAPIHHHFQMKGWHEMKVVIRFWMIGLLLALIGLASLKIQ